MMKKTFPSLLMLLVVPVGACAKEGGAPAIEAPVAVVAAEPSAPAPPPDAPRETVLRFPAGPGASLVSDQLQALIHDRRVIDGNVPYEERLALAQRGLGVPGEPAADPMFDGGVVFRAVSGRTSVAPFGCSELVLGRKAPWWTMRSADHRLCGLPYSVDLSKPYSGPAPKRSSFRLEEVLAEVSILGPLDAELKARTRLGFQDFTENSQPAWAGFGARNKDAPISCKVLRLGAERRIEDAPLTRCGLAWPMPAMTFDPGPTEPVIDKDAKLAECANTCTSNEVCMIDQRIPATAYVRTEPDGSRARYIDGRSAKVELVSSCVAIPATCAVVNASCFFPPIPPPSPPGVPMPPPSAYAGPCPVATYGGRGFLSAPSNHIMCYSRIGATVAQPVVPLPRTIAPPLPPPAPAKPPSKPGQDLMHLTRF